MTEHWYDVIIIGAGPAGSMSAYYLAKRNINVLILDKDKFPRNKICAAGLTYKTKNLVPFDISEVIENEVNSIKFSYKLQDNFSKIYSQSLMYCTNRYDFDFFLLNKALQAGAKFLENSIVTDVSDNKAFVTVNTLSGSYKARYVIGADGAKGITAKTTGIGIKYFESIGLEADIEVKDPEFLKYSESVFLDYGTIPCGYSWIFPKKKYLTIGVGCYKQNARYLNDYFKLVISKFGASITRQHQLKAFPLTHIIPGSSIIGNSVLLAGDAAGLVEPFTGEGIYYAIKSAQIASENLSGLLEKRTENDLTNYQLDIQSVIITELIEARRLQNLFNWFTAYTHQRLKDRDLYFRAFARILRGERKFSDVKKRLGMAGILWKPVTDISQRKINRKLERFNFEVEN